MPRPEADDAIMPPVEVAPDPAPEPDAAPDPNAAVHDQMFALLRQARALADAGKDDEAAPLYAQIEALEASIA
jgi:hypothetical protein